MNKAIIIGSGIAGLATAARLLSKGYDVSIFEAGEETGGKIHSFNFKMSNVFLYFCKNVRKNPIG